MHKEPFEQLADRLIGHQPTSADDVIVMIADVLSEHLSAAEALDRVRQVIDSPIALQIYENEMERRAPRDVGGWN